MTLLSEYQALPGEPLVPDPHHVPALRFEAIERRWHLDRATRREAIIRLLCRALDCAASDLERMEVATHDLRALLTAVERDFPEGV